MLPGIITILKNGGLNSKFKYPKALLHHVLKLDQMIGMVEIKDTVALMIKKHVVLEHDGNPNDGESMNHMLIVGNPGTGKTTIGEIVSKIICAIGWLQPPSSIPTTTPPRSTSNSPMDDSFFDTISLVVSAKLKDAELQKKKLTTVRCIAADMGKIIASVQEGTALDQDTIFNELKSRITILNKVMSVDSPLLSTTASVAIDIEPDFNPIFISVTRKDLVSGHVGGTASMVANKVNEAMGGVLFIDETYALVNRNETGEAESFSKECLNTLCELMSKYGRNFVCIMAGYPGETIQALMTNKGVKRRVQYTFNITDYTSGDVANIFRLQLKRAGLSLDSNINILKFIETHMSMFGPSGAVTGQLIPLIGNYYSLSRFDQIISRNVTDDTKGVVTYDMLMKSIEVIRNSNKTWDAHNPDHRSNHSNFMFG